MSADESRLSDLATALEATADIADLVEQMLEIAAIVEDALTPIGVHPIVVGGLALAYWSAGTYLTSDIDVVMPDVPQAGELLEALGFIRRGRYWTLPGREVFFEAPGTILEPTATGFDIVTTKTGRKVRVQAPEQVFGTRFEEWIHQGAPDVFQQLIWLIGSRQIDLGLLHDLAHDQDYLRRLQVSQPAYREGLRLVQAAADAIADGQPAPEPWEIREHAERLRTLER